MGRAPSTMPKYDYATQPTRDTFNVRGDRRSNRSIGGWIDTMTIDFQPWCRPPWRWCSKTGACKRSHSKLVRVARYCIHDKQFLRIGSLNCPCVGVFSRAGRFPVQTISTTEIRSDRPSSHTTNVSADTSRPRCLRLASTISS